MMTQQYKRRPSWLKVPHRAGENYHNVRRLIEQHNLNTVCKSAHCPNIGECWGRRTATFLILGDICTRNCGFCAVKTGQPFEVDEAEPERVAEAVKALNLKYAVITSVTRDDLPDGGASVFARTIKALRKALPDCQIEVLIPDFKGEQAALEVVFQAKPAVINHNLETVPRLYKTVRPQADYQRSLGVLEYLKKRGATTKTGIMVGLGESTGEIREVMLDLRAIDCDILTIGQYMQPGAQHLPIQRFVDPSEFSSFKKEALALGFKLVESAPLVRSSYHADHASEIK